MNHFKLVFSIVALLLLTNSVSAQDKIYTFNGKITDEKSQSLEGATVLLKRGLKIIKYLTTDTSGKYKFTVELPDTVQIITMEAKLLGYRAVEVVLPLQKLSISSNLVLYEEITELNEVNINEEKSSITIKGDTTSFSLKGFRQGNEKTIEDIVKKLPGMNIDESGNISFKGNRIEKVLLEGEDFYKEKYKSLTQNFNQINIDTIEAIENYLEEDLLSGFFQSGRTVLNLKLTKSDGLHASGNIQGGLGNKERYEVSSNAVIWRNKVKILNLSSFNNTANGMTNYVPEVPSYDKLNYIISQKNVSNVFLPISTLNGNLKGTELILNPNFIIRPMQRLSIKGSGGYYRQTENSLYTSGMSYYDQNSFLNQKSMGNNAAKDDAFHYEAELKFAINKTSRLKNTSLYTNTKNLLQQTEEIEQFANHSRSRYLPLFNYHKFSNTIDYLNKRNATTVYNFATSMHVVNRDNKLFNSFSRVNSSPDLIHQLTHNRNYISESFFRVLKKINSNMAVFGAGLSYNFEELSSQLDFKGTYDNNDISSSMFNYYTNAGFVKTLGNYSLSVKSSLNYVHRNLDFQNERILVNRFLPNFSIKTDFKPSIRSTISVSANYDNISVGSSQLFRERMITGNRSYTRNDEANTSIYKKTDITAFFTYTNFFDKHLSINGFLTYGERPVSATIYGVDLDRSSSLSFNNFQKPFFFSNLNFSKLIPFLASTLKLEFNHSESSYLGAINSGELQTFRNSNSTITSKILTGFKGIFNADASFSTSIATLKAKDIAEPPMMFQTKWNFYLSFENLNISSKSNLISYSNSINAKFLYSDLKLDYKPSESKLSFGGSINNLFNNTTFLQINRTNLNERLLAYKLNERFFIANLNYTF